MHLLLLKLRKFRTNKAKLKTLEASSAKSFSFNSKGELFEVDKPWVMGILNVTPDSFYDGGTKKSDLEFLNHTERMVMEGAKIIDVGGYSSRPDATDISITDELKRVIPIIIKISERFPGILISIDTFRSKVAKEAISAGANMVNDISAGKLDGKMLETISELKVPYIMMHMRGTPQTMKSQNVYDDLLKEIIYYFSERIAEARSLQIMDIIIDPGFGFAKNIEQNFELLRKLDLLHILDLPILVGLSRKSMIYKTLETSPNEALNGTTALNMLALGKGVSFLRVHDVKEAVECIKLNELYSKT